MPEPITLAALGIVALTEGIKFLYDQAGEVLKRWRERKDSVIKGNIAQLSPTESIEIKLPPIFKGQLSTPQIHFAIVEQVEEQLRGLRKDLSEYAEGIEPLDMTDEAQLQKIDALRQLLEAIYQQRLTFKGEQRLPSGPVVEGKIEVQEIAGYAAAVRARTITSGKISAKGKATRVPTGGQFVGVEIDTIGNQPTKHSEQNDSLS